MSKEKEEYEMAIHNGKDLIKIFEFCEGSIGYYKVYSMINLIEKQQKEIEAYKCLAEENENCILNHKCGNDYIDCDTCLKEYIKEIENE